MDIPVSSKRTLLFFVVVVFCISIIDNGEEEV